MPPTVYAFHPVCKLFPPMPAEELKALADHIRDHGLEQPIVLYEGKILDGRSRFMACAMAGVEPRYEEWQGEGSPLAWAVGKNLRRRHLTPGQKAVLALTLLPMLEEEAKARQKNSPGRGKKVGKEFPTFSSSGKSSDAAARLAGVNAKYVGIAKRVRKAAPELLELVASGALSLPEAERAAQLPAPQRATLVNELRIPRLDAATPEELLRDAEKDAACRARREAAPRAPRRDPACEVRVMQVSFAEFTARIPSGGGDLLVLDPPESRRETWEQLAMLARNHLRPGGWCAVWLDPSQLAAVMKAFEERLRYWWTIAVRQGGAGQAVEGGALVRRGRLLAIFGKPPLRAPLAPLNDFVSATEGDQALRSFGRDAVQAAYFLTRLTEPQALVLDPYAAAGATPVACRLTGRRCLAAVQDEEQLAGVQERLASLE